MVGLLLSGILRASEYGTACLGIEPSQIVILGLDLSAWISLPSELLYWILKNTSKFFGCLSTFRRVGPQSFTVTLLGR